MRLDLLGLRVRLGVQVSREGLEFEERLDLQEQLGRSGKLEPQEHLEDQARWVHKVHEERQVCKVLKANVDQMALSVTQASPDLQVPQGKVEHKVPKARKDLKDQPEP